MPKVLVVNNGLTACGVHEYGERVFALLAADPPPGFEYAHASCPTPDSYFRAYSCHEPDVVLWNYQDLTFPWLTHHLVDLTPAKHLGIAHDVRPGDPRGVNYNAFHLVLAQDPTLPPTLGRVWPIGRPLGATRPAPTPGKRPTVGSYGFVYARKRFDLIVESACRQYDDCLIRLRLPAGSLEPARSAENARHMADRCRRIVRDSGKPGIGIEVTHDYAGRDELVDWLAGNTVNALWYDDEPNMSGVSSCPDAFLEANRPVAVNRNVMFRHLHDTARSICLEDRTLPQIEADGPGLLDGHRARWSAAALRDTVRRAVETVLDAGPKFPLRGKAPPPNRLLRSDREYQECYQLMADAALDLPPCPIKAWGLAAVLADLTDGDLLEVGCRESPLLTGALRLGVSGDKVGIDPGGGPAWPGVTVLVRDFLRSRLSDGRFDQLACLSTVEHGIDPAAFAGEAARVLRPGGRAYVSFDYWGAGRDTTGFGGWEVFDRRKAEAFVGHMAAAGLALSSPMDWAQGDEVVRPGHWSPAGFGYTFALMKFVRA
jgi:SAM-dependent methyltransferase